MRIPTPNGRQVSILRPYAELIAAARRRLPTTPARLDDLRQPLADTRPARNYTLPTRTVCAGDNIIFPHLTWRRIAIDESDDLVNRIVAIEALAAHVTQGFYDKERHQYVLGLTTHAGVLHITPRKLLAFGVWRKPWPNEPDRRRLLDAQFRNRSNTA